MNKRTILITALLLILVLSACGRRTTGQVNLGNPTNQGNVKPVQEQSSTSPIPQPRISRDALNQQLSDTDQALNELDQSLKNTDTQENVSGGMKNDPEMNQDLNSVDQDFSNLQN